MYILTKILQITLLLFASLTLHIIPWIPSLLIENIVNFSIIGLFIFAGYLVYLVMKKIYSVEKKRNIYLNATYTILLFSYIGFFAILQIAVSFGKSHYLKTYEFEDVTFYTYLTTNGSTEVSIKEENLVLRSLPIASLPYVQIDLKKEEQ